MGKAAFKQALDDIRELSEMAAKSQSDAFEVVRERIRSNVDRRSPSCCSRASKHRAPRGSIYIVLAQ